MKGRSHPILWLRQTTLVLIFAFTRHEAPHMRWEAIPRFSTLMSRYVHMYALGCDKRTVSGIGSRDSRKRLSPMTKNASRPTLGPRGGKDSSSRGGEGCLLFQTDWLFARSRNAYLVRRIWAGGGGLMLMNLICGLLGLNFSCLILALRFGARETSFYM